MAGYEVHPDELRTVARRGDEFVDELDRLRGELGTLRLAPGCFPLGAGQQLVEAYHGWLDGYVGSVHDEAVTWRRHMTGLRDSAAGYESADVAAANDYERPFA